MALSEEEQRLLRALEQSLTAEDPELASTLAGTTLSSSDRRLFGFAILGSVISLGIVFAGALTEMVVLGIIGFILMVACAYGAITVLQRRQLRSDSARKPASNGGSVISRFEDRWNRRRDE